MTITAKFAGTCNVCGGRFQAGERVEWTKGQKGATHAVCAQALQRPAPVAPQPAAMPAPVRRSAPIPAAPVNPAGSTVSPAYAAWLLQQPAPVAPVTVPAPPNAGAWSGVIGAPVAPVVPAAGFPTLEAQGAAEGWSEYGRRALLFILATDVTGTLPDAALSAAADATGHAMAAPGLPAPSAERLADAQRWLRGLVAWRQTDPRWLALVAAEALATADATPDAPAPAAPPVPPAPPAGPTSGGGGAKVPRRPAPTGKGPSTALSAPVAVAAPVVGVTFAPCDEPF